MEYLTLMDLKNRLDPNDQISGIAEVIAKNNEILNDIPWAAGNELTGDRHIVRSENAKAFVRKINEGIPSSVSKTEVHTDTCIELASQGRVDMRELRIAPNPAQYLLSENKNKISVLGQMLSEMFFYGTDADGLRGFVPRYNKLSFDQVVNAGGTGANLGSVFFVKWDPDEVTGIYPKNAKAGLEVVTKTNESVPDPKTPSNTFLAHVSYYFWFIGLKVRDRRYVARVANVDVSSLMTDETARQKLFEHMIFAKNKIENVSQGRVVCYVSPDVYSCLEVAAFNKSNLALGFRDITSDTRILTFSGIPIRKNDCQKRNEDAVA